MGRHYSVYGARDILQMRSNIVTDTHFVLKNIMNMVFSLKVRTFVYSGRCSKYEREASQIALFCSAFNPYKNAHFRDRWMEFFQHHLELGKSTFTSLPCITLQHCTIVAVNACVSLR